MSYFQKYQKTTNQSKVTAHTHDTSFDENEGTADFRKNADSRQSYLKAFKKYYIDKLLQKKVGNTDIQSRINNKQNFCFHQTQSQVNKNANKSQDCYGKENEKMKMSVATDLQRKSKDREEPKISRSKIVSIVNNNDSELQGMLYDSISQIEKEMMSFGDINDLARENKMLKGSVSKLKLILKEKLELALKKNKQELTMMFEEYSNMIKKLLEDKEKLTNQLQVIKNRLIKQEQRVEVVEEEYQNKIRIIVEENNTQISNTKQQIEEFLDMIIQYEEESEQEKQQLQKLREKVVELEIQNDKLKNNYGDQSNRRGATSTISINHKDLFQSKVTEQIQNLLAIIQKLQEDNQQLKQFLKSCKCSRIKSKAQLDSRSQSETDISQDLISKYQKKIVEAQKNYIKQQVVMRQALRKKDECIDRLNMIINELKRNRYASVDRMTEQTISRQQQK